MSNVTSIIAQLAATRSKNEKHQILSANADNEVLKEVFRIAYAKEINFFVRSFKVSGLAPGLTPLSEGLDLLVKNIANRVYTGDDAKSYMTQLVQTSAEPDTLLKVINRDLECGIQTTITNKVWKNLVVEPPYQSYTLFKPDLLRKFNYAGAFSDEKLDGLYADILVWPDQIVFRSRSGLELNFRVPENVEKGLMAAAVDDDGFPDPYVAHGEGLVIDPTYESGVQPREIGNGYLNQDPDKIDRDRVLLVVWDRVSMDEYIARKSTKKYRDRRAEAKDLTLYVEDDKHFQFVKGREVKNIKESIDHFVEMRKLKREGTVLKQADMPWGDTKTKKGIKLKNEFDVDLVVVGTLPHKKDPSLIGSLVCQTRDGLLEVGAGSGLTAEMRKLPPEYFIGQIVTIKANDVTDSESKELRSLFLPRLNYKFVEIRKDKSVANSLEEVIEAADSLLALLLEIAAEVGE